MKKEKENKMETKGIVLTGEEAKNIPDGAHEGTITDVKQESRGQGKDKYSYVDLYIRLDGIEDIEMRDGYPAKLTDKTGLGQLLMRFGHKVEIGKPLDISGALKGKRIKCLTQEETTDRGTFARIVRGSVSPA